MDAPLKVRLRSALLSLEDRNLDTQGSFSAKLLIDGLQSSGLACLALRDLVSGGGAWAFRELHGARKFATAVAHHACMTAPRRDPRRP